MLATTAIHGAGPGTAPAEDSAALRLLLIALAAVVLFHGGLLPFTHGNTYDAYIHMFFGDSYRRSWFDVWEPRWYTGFATTSYPPGTHMMIGALSHVMPLRGAFVLVQLAALMLLTVGVFRFSRLWVGARASGYAALALALSSSISETVHLFGQLPTTLSLGLFLNGMPAVRRWIAGGRWPDLLEAVIFAGATTAAHHVTTIFGGVLFVLPLGVGTLVAVLAEARAGRQAQPLHRRLLHGLRVLGWPVARGLLMGALMLAAILLTVFPYWSWSINDPITQVPIPHGSRESFIARPDLGVIFFLLPWGVMLLLLPCVVWLTATTRLWPLGLSVLLCFVLGTGGTTPIPRALLRGAFDILTLDRFTFWATILILPIAGRCFESLLHGRGATVLRAAFGRIGHRATLAGLFLALVLGALVPVVLPVLQPTQPRAIDPGPIARFMAEDEHDRWRYLTLGFGDQFAYISALTDAQSVDGNYHSARRLPDMTRFSVERLENAKYLGVPGLGSLRQFVVNADAYHLRYVFSNDEFYDPLLFFSGWTRLNRLPNGITLWERQDVTPLTAFLPRRDIPVMHLVMWGLLPPFALSLAGLALLLGLRRALGTLPAAMADATPDLRPVAGWLRHGLRLGLGLAVFAALGLAVWAWAETRRPLPPDAVVRAFFDDLDFRRFAAAYDRLDPVTRPAPDAVLFNWRWTGGLVASYGKLTGLTLTRLSQSEAVIDWDVRLDWLTPLNMQSQTLRVQTVRRGEDWFVLSTTLRPVQTPVLLQRDEEVAFNVVGRRQPRPETDLHRDRMDRPRIALSDGRLVLHEGRYSLVGSVTNADADPAMVSIFADLRAGGATMVRQSCGEVCGLRLLPAETAGFRVDFEGVLSLDDALAEGGYDPRLFVPPELPARPDSAGMEARAVVSEHDLYRGVALNALRLEMEGQIPVLTGLAVNTGTETATVIRVLVLLYDDGGQPVWAEAGYVDRSIFPGQSAPFRLTLPPRDSITVVAGAPATEAMVNGSAMQADLAPPGAAQGTIPVTTAPGYSALRAEVTSMTHDPLF